MTHADGRGPRKLAGPERSVPEPADRWLGPVGTPELVPSPPVPSASAGTVLGQPPTPTPPCISGGIFNLGAGSSLEPAVGTGSPNFPSKCGHLRIKVPPRPRGPGPSSKPPASSSPRWAPGPLRLPLRPRPYPAAREEGRGGLPGPSGAVPGGGPSGTHPEGRRAGQSRGPLMTPDPSSRFTFSIHEGLKTMDFHFAGCTCNLPRNPRGCRASATSSQACQAASQAAR